MKLKNNLFLLMPFLLVLVFLVSCSEEIIVKNDQKQTAVIYSLLDQADTIHYFRINKAFLGTANSLEEAQIPDSSYFKSVDATVYELHNSDTIRKWKLRDTIIANKDTNGIFFAPTQKLYYFETTTGQPLIAQSGYSYYFKATFDKIFAVTGSTELIRNAKIGTPSSPGSSFSFASNNIANFGYFSTSISVNNGSATTMNISVNANINEFRGLDVVKNKIVWDINTTDVDLNSTNAISASGEDFYKLIKSHCINDNTITKRQLHSMEIEVTLGSEDFRKYILYSKPSSSIAQNQLNYTNLVASNGMRVRGIFASRHVLKVTKKAYDQYTQSYYYRAIDLASMRELCLGQYTGNLLFCSDVPVDSKESFYCK